MVLDRQCAVKAGKEFPNLVGPLFLYPLSPVHTLIHYHQPARTLRYSSLLLLYQPATRINFQYRTQLYSSSDRKQFKKILPIKAFSITAPAVWNSLSPAMKSSATITTFKTHLKTELFVLCCIRHGVTFLPPRPAPQIRTLSIWRHL